MNENYSMEYAFIINKDLVILETIGSLGTNGDGCKCRYWTVREQFEQNRKN
jgi:hypothetical protein